MKTEEIPRLLDKSELLLRIDQRLANLERERARDSALLTEAYQRMANQIGILLQTVAKCPPTCPHRANFGSVAEE